MKVLLVNGSPHKEGCTYTALKEVEKTLKPEELFIKLTGKESVHLEDYPVCDDSMINTEIEEIICKKFE